MQNYLEYKESLDETYLTILANLNELEKIYPMQKLAPNYKPYLDEYNQSKENLEKSLTNLISIRNSIKKDLLSLNSNVSGINKNLTKIDEENESMLEEKQNLDDNSGAPGELQQKNNIYKEKLLQNIYLILAIFLFIGIYFRVSGLTLSKNNRNESNNNEILPKQSVKNLALDKSPKQNIDNENIFDHTRIDTNIDTPKIDEESKNQKLNKDLLDNLDVLFDST